MLPTLEQLYSQEPLRYAGTGTGLAKQTQAHYAYRGVVLTILHTLSPSRRVLECVVPLHTGIEFVYSLSPRYGCGRSFVDALNNDTIDTLTRIHHHMMNRAESNTLVLGRCTIMHIDRFTLNFDVVKYERERLLTLKAWHKLHML